MHLRSSVYFRVVVPFRGYSIDRFQAHVSLNLCAFVVLDPFEYANHFDLGGLREHVERLNFLNPKPAGETL